MFISDKLFIQIINYLEFGCIAVYKTLKNKVSLKDLYATLQHCALHSNFGDLYDLGIYDNLFLDLAYFLRANFGRTY